MDFSGDFILEGRSRDRKGIIAGPDRPLFNQRNPECINSSGISGYAENMTDRPFNALKVMTNSLNYTPKQTGNQCHS